MKVLFSSDWQTDRGNVDICERAFQDMLGYIKKHDPKVIVLAGDLKEHYDPVHVVVIKFWVRCIQILTKMNKTVIVLLGNHDRLSQSPDSKNWLDILRAAGARIVTQPKVLHIDAKVAMGFLPYTSDRELEVEWAEKLHAQVVSDKKEYGLDYTCGVFHTELFAAVMNSANIKGRGNTVEELCLDKYDIAVGGHLHGHQRLPGTNAYYIGSPFCQDWSEANSPKGFVVIDFEGKKPTLTFLKSSIPCWYDLAYLHHTNTVPEQGAYIRSKVEVTSKKISAQLRRCEDEIRGEFKSVKDLRVFVIPRMTEPAKLDVEITGQTDLERVGQYVTATLPEGAKYPAGRVVAYLASRLARNALAGRSHQIKYLYTRARNVLSFKEVEVRYNNRGLVLLRGINEDWPGRSNGAGKTNVLSLLPIAMFGRSLKGQVNDSWARENTEGVAEIETCLRDGKGRKIVINRQRRKHKLTVHMDGEDISSGITGKRKMESQGLIEELTGYNLKMFENAVTIDQTIANGFVFGSQADRMDLIGKIIDLDRYADALKIIGDEITVCQKEMESLVSEIDTMDEQLIGLQSDLDECSKSVQTEWTIKYEEAKAELERLRLIKVEYQSKEKYMDKRRTELDSLLHEEMELVRRRAEYESTAASLHNQVQRAIKLLREQKCGMCGQPTEKVADKMLKDLQKQVPPLEEKINESAASLKTKRERITAIKFEIEKYISVVDSCDIEYTSTKNHLETILHAAVQEKERNAKLLASKDVLIKEIRKQSRIVQAMRERERDLEVDMSMFTYAKKAVHRSGMPMYMAASLCPLLNKAAEEYSDVFTRGDIRLNFAVVDGEFVVDVVNPAGSETRQGQSVGETAMAGIVAAFSVRETAPKTNLLVLDEPGSGLDALGAKAFARGLLKLKDRFSTIIVTTHNPTIEGILAGETTWTVTKRDGISHLSIE